MKRKFIFPEMEFDYIADDDIIRTSLSWGDGDGDEGETDIGDGDSDELDI